MNDTGRLPAHSLSIAAVERDTGLSKDTLRVWERRYGFPCPQRDAAGDRIYPPDQVERLHAIRRLMDAGHRPGRVVALDWPALQLALAELKPAAASLAASPEGRQPDLGSYLDVIACHDAHRLRGVLEQALLRLGLVRFVTQVVAPLNVLVGEAWMQGRFQVFEEHMYTECVTGVLRSAIGTIRVPQGAGSPRVLLTTFPGEPHGLGLLMAEAMLVLEGCACLSLGTQTPLGDIVQAARAHQADIVALSFTPLAGMGAVTAGLQELVTQLPPETTIWAGGLWAVQHLRPVEGVVLVPDLDTLGDRVERWRRAMHTE